VTGERIAIDPAKAAARTVDGELVIYDLVARAFVGGNAAAARVWPLLERGATLAELAAELDAAYGIGEEQAAADAEAFVAVLRGRDLLLGPP
jgi:hypothetical protein